VRAGVRGVRGGAVGIELCIVHHQVINHYL
jgi:hypothetical protein